MLSGDKSTPKILTELAKCFFFRAAFLLVQVVSSSIVVIINVSPLPAPVR